MAGTDWDIHYQNQTGLPPWETGNPSSELARVLAEAKIAPNTVFELGCGRGINAVWLAQQGFDVTGIDFNQLAIQAARERAQAAGLKIRFELADVCNLPDGFGRYAFFFDRGCYHSIRDTGLSGYVRTLEWITEPGSRGLILTGNTNDPAPPGQGPPRVAEADLHRELEPLFRIVQLREFRFDSIDPSWTGPLAWSCLLERA